MSSIPLPRRQTCSLLIHLLYVQTVNATNTQLLAVGTYNSYQTLYPGFTNSTNFTWTGATSNTLLNPFTFTVSAVRC